MTRTAALSGRVAVVTGASSGIGEATALALADAGAAVSLAARRRTRLEDLARRIESAGGRALVVPTDVSRLADVRNLVDRTLEAFGTVDILVNNAGVMPLSPLSAMRLEDWERMVDVNLKGVLNGLAAVLPTMLARSSGHIVNVGSVAGRRPFPGGSVYSATKFAVRALSAGIHLELSARHGIRVTDIEPGGVDTELLEHVSHEESRATFEARWAGKEKLQAEDVAEAILYAVTAPERVNVNEILVRPTDQET